MSEHLKRFLARPTVPTPFTRRGEATVFIIDPVHTVEAWTVFGQHNMRYNFDQLFVGTRNAERAKSGPWWFVIPDHREGMEALAAVCCEWPFGLVLSCTYPEAALAHARAMIDIKTSQGTGLSVFSSASCWAAFAMADNPQFLAELFGPLARVYTPAPAADPQVRRWHEWKNQAPSAVPLVAPLILPRDGFDDHDTLHWVFWLREHPQQFGHVPDSDLARLISNLNTLVRHGIGREYDLLDVVPIIVGPPLAQRPAVMAILKQSGPAHRRVAQLQQVQAA